MHGGPPPPTSGGSPGCDAGLKFGGGPGPCGARVGGGLADPIPRLETEGPFLEAFGAELFGTLKLR